MNEMKTYRALQTHAANINQLVVSLYNGGINAESAMDAAERELQITADKLKAIKAEAQ